MFKKISFSIVVVLMTALSACAGLRPGGIVADPDPIYYGDCSDGILHLTFTWPKPEIPEDEYNPKKQFVHAEYRLINISGDDVAKGDIPLPPMKTSTGELVGLGGEVLFRGDLDLKPLVSLLKGGEGSLVYVARIYVPWPVMGSYIPHEVFHSDSRAVEAIPCSRKPTDTPALSAMITPAGLEPSFAFKEAANCRSGPGTLYPVVKNVDNGESLPVMGRSEAGDWLFVSLPDNQECWVSGSLGTLSVGIDQIQTHSYPPVPQPQPSPTATVQQGCYVYDPQQNPVCTVPCPANAQPGGSCTP